MRESGEGKPLYLYFDEAGDLNFKENGSKWFMVTCVAMQRPFRVVPVLMKLRYDLIEEGVGLDYFHASEDTQAVRDAVFSEIESHLDDFAVFTYRVDKSQFGGTGNPKELYQAVFGNLVRFVSASCDFEGVSQVIAITDALPNAARKANVRGQLVKAMKERFPGGMPWRLQHQRSEGDFNLQIADYFCWAKFRLEERGDRRSFDRIAGAWKGEGKMIRAKTSDLPA